ncbi:hypothetical protein AX774_g2661 [Zancudomyces culisetae]|uniref:Uncharacterized protein n=1 Tax=Zancudomyces culisetae TaxID=1213189 RepID=A0A1R1PS69_ZANCU|nr:hypothetical protein AX774_g2661 [Zancudomyces culisetae]|eukprot:OMH83830.1 hypothetical protein AX774_g2661 [Zancudomyces culisetae]
MSLKEDVTKGKDAQSQDTELSSSINDSWHALTSSTESAIISSREEEVIISSGKNVVENSSQPESDDELGEDNTGISLDLQEEIAESPDFLAEKAKRVSKFELTLHGKQNTNEPVDKLNVQCGSELSPFPQTSLYRNLINETQTIGILLRTHSHNKDKNQSSIRRIFVGLGAFFRSNHQMILVTTITTMVLPFVSGAMIGLGEVFANEVLTHFGWKSAKTIMGPKKTW